MSNEFDELIKLPEKWKWTISSEVCSSVRDGTHDTPKYLNTGIPLVTSKNLKEGKIDFLTAKFISIEDHLQISIRSGVEDGDILFAMIGTIGNPVIVKTDKQFSIKNVALFKKKEDIICPSFLRYWLSSPYFEKLLEAQKLIKGSTQRFIPLGSLRILPVPLAPLNEQKRIADKLDRLMAKVDACRERCDRIPLILKRFRQSVLAAATSGELTEDWRETQSFEGLHVVTLRDVATSFSYGSSAKSSPVGDIPVLRMGNIQQGKLDWNDLVFTSNVEEIEKYWLVSGDVLFNRTNSPELVGKTAIYKGERSAIYAGYLIRVRCGTSLLPDYLNYCLNSPAGRDYCWQVKSDGVSQSNINAKKLAAFQFDLPTVEEQKEIIHRVEKLFAFADRLESRYKAARAKCDRLTPALLEKAFQGELVPQDPTDEPASVLLERIKAQHAKAEVNKTKQKTSQRKSKMTQLTKASVEEIIRQFQKDTFSFDELRELCPGDYELLKNILFSLLSEDKAKLKQVFDSKTQAIQFVKGER